MLKAATYCKIFLVLCLVYASGAAQTKDRVEISAKFFADNSARESCKNLKPAQPLNLIKLSYPPEAKSARIGGTILMTVKIDEKGTIPNIQTVSGNQVLINLSVAAAKKIKFVPANCNGIPTASLAILSFNFIPSFSPEKYYTPVKISEFIDLKTDSPFYEAISNLTENYNLAFGYEDQKYYADAPLTHGDLAHFLRRTLDLLSIKAAAVNKLPREINLFFPRNPQKIISPNSIKNLNRDAPFYDSVRTLLLKYDVTLTDDTNEFEGSRHLTNNEVIDLWSEIFGAEAVPVNFEKKINGDQIISRGEFALFLAESLQVLTYKTLP